MGCPPIDEVTKDKDRVTIHVEGASITYVLKENGELKFVWRSENYLQLFRFRPLCQIKHEEAALKAFSEINQKVPTVKKRERRKKKVRVSKYAIDEENLVSDKLRDRQFWDSERFSVDENGQYVVGSFEDIIKTVRDKIREQYKIFSEKKEETDHQQFVVAALNEIGCFDRWSRGRIQSELSKRMHARRMAKKEKVKNQIINDAKKIERDHHQLPLEID